MSPVPLDFVPENDEQLMMALADPMWRICSGYLYKIMVKSPIPGEAETVVPFKPNAAQLEFLDNLWNRNLILKARQLGFTTLASILWLDHAMFVADQRCGIIAQDRDSAEAFFRDKVRLAYDRLPALLKKMMPLKRESASELLFAHNNSSMRVATSMRGGTIHRLHVSEFGRICAHFPDKAVEIVTGSIPAVPLDGIAIIESTAEGQDGEFYKMTKRAMAIKELGQELTVRDYRFHFYAWWKDPGYRLEGGHVVITEEDQLYFDATEIEIGQKIDQSQRRWYVATRESDFSGDPEKMWQEYPSTPMEAFKVSSEGKYFAQQLAKARRERRITTIPVVENIPVNTFWDIGKGDGTGAWLHQRVDLQDRFIGYIEGWNEPYGYYTKKLQALGYLWGVHHVPHDATHQRQQLNTLTCALDELKKSSLGGEWKVVPRVEDLQHGIQLTRAAFSSCWFDETACKEGLLHLENYGKKWNEAAGCWSETPKKDVHTEAADAFRQFAQGFDGGTSNIGYTRNRQRNWKTA